MRHHQRDRLIELLDDPGYRHEFFGSLISASIAAQIKANREDREWTQAQLADRAGMKQQRICTMENVNYQRFTIGTLRRLAEALDLTLAVRFESFGKAIDRLGRFQESLVETPYKKDPAIQGAPTRSPELLQFRAPESRAGEAAGVQASEIRWSGQAASQSPVVAEAG